MAYQQNQTNSLNTQGQYVLYYSNYCINCKEFINILCKTPIYSSFTKVNVSDGKTRFPSFVKSVPTIIVPNVNKPLVGEEVFTWLEKQSDNRIKNEKESIIAYSPGEMGGFGDNYSYFGSDDAEQPMEQTFSYIKRADQKIETPPEESFGETKQKSAHDINSTNRPPFPQTSQMQTSTQGPPMETPDFTKPISSSGAGGRGPMVPLSSGGDEGNIDDAYNELLARRKMDSPNDPLPDVPPR